MDVIAIREYELGEEPIDDQTGQPARGRVVYRVARRTGKMRRMEQNAFIRLQDGEAVVNLGDRELARVLAAIQAWEGPGLDGLPVTLETLDALEQDAFMVRVYKEIETAYSDKKDENPNPKALASTPPRIVHGSSANVPIPLAPIQSSTFNVEPGLDGRLIIVTP